MLTYLVIAYTVLCFAISVQFCVWFKREEGILTLGMVLMSLMVGFSPIINVIFVLAVYVDKLDIPNKMGEFLDKRIL
jgi:hypothetical protein